MGGSAPAVAETTAAVDQPVVVSARVLSRWLLVAILALNVANAVTLAFDPEGGRRWLLLGFERNPSTWFSGAQLALAAGLAYTLSRRRPDGDRWRLVALLLLVMSVDEVGTIHERIGGPEGLPQATARAWVVAGTVLVVLTVRRLLPWALRLEPALRTALVTGGAVFVLGAIGCEEIAASWEQGHGQDRWFWLVSTVEENLELFGVYIVVRALLDHLARTGGRIELAVSG